MSSNGQHCCVLVFVHAPGPGKLLDFKGMARTPKDAATAVPVMAVLDAGTHFNQSEITANTTSERASVQTPDISCSVFWLECPGSMIHQLETDTAAQLTECPEQHLSLFINIART